MNAAEKKKTEFSTSWQMAEILNMSLRVRGEGSDGQSSLCGTGII